MKTISLKIPEELHNLLVQLSVKRGQNISSLIRETLQDHLALDENATSASFYLKGRDLIGSVQGPEDLSSNKDHMQGYGES